MHLWPGYCPTHMKILPEDILRLKKEHPGAVAMVHPECRPDAKAAADEVLSTGGMMRYARESMPGNSLSARKQALCIASGKKIPKSISFR